MGCAFCKLCCCWCCRKCKCCHKSDYESSSEKEDKSQGGNETCTNTSNQITNEDTTTSTANDNDDAKTSSNLKTSEEDGNVSDQTVTIPKQKESPNTSEKSSCQSQQPLLLPVNSMNTYGSTSNPTTSKSTSPIGTSTKTCTSESNAPPTSAESSQPGTGIISLTSGYSSDNSSSNIQTDSLKIAINTQPSTDIVQKTVPTSIYPSTSEYPQQLSDVPATSGTQPSKAYSHMSISGTHPSSEHGLVPSSGYHPHQPVTQSFQQLRPYFSYATLENARYSVDQPPRPDHVNDDRAFVINREGRATILAVFDGHDGNKASSFVDDCMYSLFNSDDTLNQLEHFDVRIVLTNLFLETEQAFFDKLQPLISEKELIQRTIPKDISSYQAYMFYPEKVKRLQEIEPEIAGGTTAVVAVIVNGSLYVANTGDSRAIVVRNTENGQVIDQLSTDHTVENPDELSRLTAIGLDAKELQRTGRLGSQENTRCIGDYSIKQGYKDVDTLSHATIPPGEATPTVNGPIPIDPSFQYLLLMTDGVYKSLESLSHPPDHPQRAMLSLLYTIQQTESTSQDNLGNVAAVVLDQIKNIHEQTYMTAAQVDPRSSLAVQCRKRDDMTLVVLHF